MIVLISNLNTSRFVSRLTPSDEVVKLERGLGVLEHVRHDPRMEVNTYGEKKKSAFLDAVATAK